jgi:hypothetical protein
LVAVVVAVFVAGFFDAHVYGFDGCGSVVLLEENGIVTLTLLFSHPSQVQQSGFAVKKNECNISLQTQK